MSFCVTCGAKLGADVRFCPVCGTAIDQYAVSRSATGPAAGEQGSRRIVSVLFADVVGSTAMGETLDAEAVRRVMDAWFATARGAIERHGGTVEKFIGDAVMAVFGVPVLHEDDAHRAVRAAIDLQDGRSNIGSIAAGAVLEIRVGIATGDVIAIDPRDGQTFVTGDAVNVAARLQASAEPGQILIDPATHRLVADSVAIGPAIELELKGKRQAVNGYVVRSIDPNAQAITRRFDGPLIGRESELARIQAEFEKVTASRICRGVTVVGDPGIGKSRLVHEFLASTRPRANVIRGRCLSYGDGITYWPLVSLIDEAAGIDSDADAAEARARIERLVSGMEHGPLIARQLEGVAGRGEPLGAPQEIAWAIRRLFETLAAERPLIVVLDDIQWAEPALLELVEHVVARIEGSAVLLLCIARREIFETSPAWMRGGGTATIRLEPLGTEDGSRLVDGLLGEAALDPATRERIAAAADGNPLFIEQLLAMLVDDGILAREEGRWIARQDLALVDIPMSIRALLAARLDRLDRSEKATIERASVVGKVFWWGSVVELTPEAERPRVGSDLASLMRRELVRADPTMLVGDEAFRFQHLLVRDAAYAALAKEERARLHVLFAAWLEARGTTPVDDRGLILGYHLEQAYRYRVELRGPTGEDRSLAERALTYLRPAATAASDRGDTRTAIPLMRRALSLTEEGRDRIELLFDLAAVLARSGDPTGRRDAESEARGLLARFPDGPLQQRSEIIRAHALIDASPPGWYDEAMAIVASVVRECDLIDDSQGRLRALNLRAFLKGARGSFEAERATYEEALLAAQEAHDGRRADDIMATIALRAIVDSSPVTPALERCKAFLEVVHDDLEHRADILLAVGVLEAMVGQMEVSRGRMAEVRVIVNELGLMMPLGVADEPMMCANAELIGGDPASVEEHIRWGCAESERLGDLTHLASLAPLLAEILLCTGDLAGAEHYVTVGRELTQDDDLDAMIRWRMAAAGIAIGRGERVTAVALARDAIGIVGPTEFLPLRYQAQLRLAEALRAAGDEPGARDAAEESARLAELKEDRASEARARAFLLNGVGPD
jgi:class 3 adenylate cyclase